jgi:hypothetical protein
MLFRDQLILLVFLFEKVLLELSALRAPTVGPCVIGRDIEVQQEPKQNTKGSIHTKQEMSSSNNHFIVQMKIAIQTNQNHASERSGESNIDSSHRFPCPHMVLFGICTI